MLVTGAGSGMGKAAARLLTELGANVYATVRRKPVDFAVAKQIPCDLGSKEGVDAMLAQLPMRWKPSISATASPIRKETATRCRCS